jgi:hypothetical protein
MFKNAPSIPSAVLGLAALGLVASLSLSGCSKSNPNSPTSTTGSATVTVPKPVKPLNGAVVPNGAQPTQLVVENALTTAGGVTYTFEVAADSTFTNKVQVKEGVIEGISGQTSVTLDILAAGKEYYWRARTEAGGTQGIFSAPVRFSVGAAVSLSTPVPISPVAGAATGSRPSLIVRNVTKTGPAGVLTYRFEIADTSAFSPVVSSGTATEGVGQTAFIPPQDLNPNQTYFWRATAIDQASAASSAASVPQSFTTSLAIDLRTIIVSYTDAPQDIAKWAQTARITSVEQDGAGDGPMCIAFNLTKEWPSIPFFGDPNVPIYANQWNFARINNQWYGGPGEYLRSDRSTVCKTGQTTNGIGPDGGWTSPMRSWAPKVGELVGYMVSTPARNYSAHHTINERTDVILQPWRDTSLGSAIVP